MEQFLEKLADILEDFEEWDSLAILSIISVIGSDYNKTVTVNDIKKAKTIKGLKGLIQG